ncbi:hypothetical protein V3481_013660 [Fusarium oxysporum f. sp. vasinfectum]|uniref:Extracellular serine-rich protein n=2 Tax=Fusarium oxysporum TaxID=5507 RepID=A0A420S8X8_FUSOX|nr:hypothetical protein FOTG_04061 [Fusarium oxysporum f. sp. vasinfectum 25433]KAK2693789.1 hypothetical protein QWA68_008300 [Fusarium oxysporum]RKL25740.1 hypothetical protein BFJ68_g367 [Fusarium oxysporum]
MVSKSLLVLTAALATAWAQTTTDEPTATAEESSTGTSSGEAVTHTVNVGASGHKFTPNEVKAEVGDIIEWRFYPTDHWVIRGDYDNPCIPYEYIGVNRQGFSSGTQKVQAITDDGPRYRVRVNNTDPFFFYCGAPESCSKWKMMGVVNPSKNETIEGWLKNAEDVDMQLRPGDPWPKEGESTSTGATSEPTADNSDEDDESSGSGKKSLSTGAIAGIAVGGAAVLLLAGALLYLCGRRGGFDKAYRKSFRNSVPSAPPVVENPYSPHPSVADPWAAQKSPGLVAAPYGQSPPLSPHQSMPYGTHPGMVAQDGTPISYHEGYHQPPMAASPATTPKPHEQIAPVELPGSPDPNHSPLPAYNNNNNNDGRGFSWNGDEQGYRPTK